MFLSVVTVVVVLSLFTITVMSLVLSLRCIFPSYLTVIIAVPPPTAENSPVFSSTTTIVVLLDLYFKL